MKGLLLRLSALDADAESAVRVIAYFDALVAARADAASLVRATAALAECGAGLATPDTGRVRYSEDGMPRSADGSTEPKHVSGWMSLGGGGRVWLERPGPPRPLDELVLERMAIAAQAINTRARPSLHIADPALVELVLSDRESAEDRARALRLLGLLPDVTVRAMAISLPAGMDVGVQAVALMARGRLGRRTVRVAVLGRMAAVLLQDRTAAASPSGDLRVALAERLSGRTSTTADDQPAETSAGGQQVSAGFDWSTGPWDGAAQPRVGIGGPVDGLDARHSWRQACLALRFAAPGSADSLVVDYSELGSVALLADVPVDRLRSNPDVRALDGLAQAPSGAADIAVLEAYCQANSLRQAAAVLHLHHSSVAARVAHLEDVLGWRLDEPEGRFRARLALLARRLATAL
ncbi:helix-turn-helix domain-containing protein [Frankia sp. CNm7]|uniref:Helix-turn-helix domain-containing protein n=1 Tax=Frankia nepalensis TaxID=1836974 RepID=A0A937RJC7_9ACTN|nr:helix-turn-helix domain-containing protein [Frankia nepalensis]MBL7499314.1 helix-turn-helix domain-containing protein [Frankia nepalensis]MBL7512701.1 helix-turn-helix domain-containing protein [Frankia nepalensis]MBL7517705.1 helix-turn-helix domain-containing protein [Frankia nepalensis]MBL7629914.1 helix-turn-helix domain-containing protein [Frankia nepalensis]